MTSLRSNSNYASVIIIKRNFIIVVVANVNINLLRISNDLVIISVIQSATSFIGFNYLHWTSFVHFHRVIIDHMIINIIGENVNFEILPRMIQWIPCVNFMSLYYLFIFFINFSVLLLLIII